jgi:hypothetical protein
VNTPEYHEAVSKLYQPARPRRIRAQVPGMRLTAANSTPYALCTSPGPHARPVPRAAEGPGVGGPRGGGRQ